MRTPRSQAGISIVAALMLVAIIGMIGTLSVRLIPHYIDYGTIISIIQELPADRVHKMTVAEMRDTLKKRFLINNIRDLDPRTILKVERKRDGTTLTLDYERRESLLYNVDLILVFRRDFHYT